MNLWDKMTKLKFKNWNDVRKNVKTSGSAENVDLKASNSLSARMLVVAKSSREFNLKDVISNYELYTVNRMLMNVAGDLHPCSSKSDLLHILENIAETDSQTNSPGSAGEEQMKDKVLVFDGMAVLNELTVMSSRIKNCKDLAYAFARLIESKSAKYLAAVVVFDDYSRSTLLKDVTRERRAAGKNPVAKFQITDSTAIRDLASFIKSIPNKNLLIKYIAENSVLLSTSDMTIVSTHGLFSNSQRFVLDDLKSSQEEADTLVILYGAELCRNGFRIDIYSSDTDVLVLALSELQLVGFDTCMILGTGDHRRYVVLREIYSVLGELKVSALKALHALSGCDTTGVIRGKGKKMLVGGIYEP